MFAPFSRATLDIVVEVADNSSEMRRGHLATIGKLLIQQGTRHDVAAGLAVPAFTVHGNRVKRRIDGNIEFFLKFEFRINTGKTPKMIQRA